MFKCQVTGRFSKPGEKCNKIVISTREKSYYEKVMEDGEEVELEIGRGWEIVKEINATEEGVRIYNYMVENGTVENFIRSIK